MLQIIIQGVLSVTYPGGALEFNKDFVTYLTDDQTDDQTDGQTFFVAPRKDAEIPELVQEKLRVLAEELGFKLIFAETSNFRGMEEDEANERLREDLKEAFGGLSSGIRVFASGAILDISCPDLTEDSEEGKHIKDSIKAIPYISNIRLSFKDNVALILEGETPTTEVGVQASKVYSKLCTGRPDRETVISKDEVMDVTIALGRTNSVEEFLELI